MDETAQQRTQKYVSARKQHPAWILLASHRAPLVLGCLSVLFDHADDGIAEEDALQLLTDMLTEYASQDDYNIESDNPRLIAGRELREWIKRRLIIERGQRLYATDALSAAIRFIDSLDSRIMTSTASRLSVVQREIENLAVSLNANPVSRIASLKSRIKALQHELAEAESGDIPVLSEAEAVEQLREVYGLAIGLRADFRRVEDSWREADRQLRQSIMTEQLHRGQIVDQLLDGQAALVNTPEGRVFESFQEQLRQSVELDAMVERLRTILSHPAAEKALLRGQIQDLKHLPRRLVKESQAVMQARARSERDVKGFLKTGLAAEHHRVGQLLNEIFQAALDLDWQKQAIRRDQSPLPPVGISLGTLPVTERLRFKALDDVGPEELDLSTQDADLTELEDEFWQALDGLDRQATVQQTLQLLAQQGRALTLAELCVHLPPVHDLETLALWLEMAREAGISIDTLQHQQVELTDQQQRRWLFNLPYLAMSEHDLKEIDWEFL